MSLVQSGMNAECPVYASMAYKITHTQLRSREPNSLCCPACKELWATLGAIEEHPESNIISAQGLELRSYHEAGAKKNKMPCMKRRITVTNPVRAVTTECTIKGPHAHQTLVIIETWGLDYEEGSAEPGDR